MHSYIQIGIQDSGAKQGFGSYCDSCWKHMMMVVMWHTQNNSVTLMLEGSKMLRQCIIISSGVLGQWHHQ